jgi:flagellar biosynthesis protein FlhF
MHLRRFRRETVQDALRAAREALGPGALVLSTRTVSAPGVRGLFGARYVEVTAAAERPEVSDFRPSEDPEGSALRARLSGIVGRTRQDSPARDGEGGSPVAIGPAARTKRTRRGLAKLASIARNDEKRDRAVASLAARLQATGLDAALAQDVATAHSSGFRGGATIHDLRKTLADRLAPLAAADKAFAPVEVFIGPPGVGKTTTIAKIASQERARRGARLGLVAADGFRVGAVEQLRLYADVLGTPLAVARTPHELEAALSAAGPRRPLLVDTAGRSPQDEISRDMLRVLEQCERDVRTHLVIAADTPVATARRVLDRFEDARPSRLVITKLDEAESLAPIVGLLRDRSIPISYLGTGQSVPEDLERATPPSLAAWVAGDPRQGATA